MPCLRPEKALSLNIGNFISPAPSIKFRGIFINDEDWGLQPWAARTFEAETKDIGPKTYAKVFELLLRLKANLIWLAMHPSTKAFYHYPGNVKAAEDYQVVVGSSRAEPMLRNNVSEWNEKAMGHFNFVTNRKKVEAYWEERIRESAGFNGIYTTGMRGVHDGEIQGVKTIPETVALLDTIIRVEREMLQKYVNKDITKIPQVFTPIKRFWKYMTARVHGLESDRPTTHIQNTAHNHNFYGDQAQQRLDDYTKLLSETTAIQLQIANKDQPAFFELVGYPVKAATLMNRKFLYRDKAYLYARQGRVSAAHYALLSGQAYAEIVMETGYFNEKLLNGKWKGMMDMRPRELPVFKMEEFKLALTPNLPAFRALPEGLDTAYAASTKKREYKLPVFDRWNRQKRFIDVFLTQKVQKNFRITASDPWIRVSAVQGALQPVPAQSEQRIWVEIDWANAGIGELSGNIVVQAGDDRYDFKVTANNADANTLADFKGYVPNDKYISINAAKYTGLKKTATHNWEVVEALAGNGDALQACPLAFKGRPDTVNLAASASGEYEFHTFTDAPAAITVSTLPTYPINKDFEMRYAVKVDDLPIQIFNFQTIGRSNEWK